MTVIPKLISWIFLSIAICLKQCQEKIPPEKSPPVRVKGKVRVRLGIRLDLESGGFFPGGDFPLEPCKTVHYGKKLFNAI